MANPISKIVKAVGAAKEAAPASKIIVSPDGNPITYIVKGRRYSVESGKYTKDEVMDVLAEKELDLEESAKAAPKVEPGRYEDDETDEIVEYDAKGTRTVIGPRPQAKPAMTSKVGPKPQSKEFRNQFVAEFKGNVDWVKGTYEAPNAAPGTRAYRLHGAPTTVPTNIKGRPLKDALELLADRWGSNATAMENVYSNLAKGMLTKNRDFVQQTKFVISDNVDPESGSYGGLYIQKAISAEGPMIHLPETVTRFSSPERIMYTVMHEAGHGATVHELDNSVALADDFKNLHSWAAQVLLDGLKTNNFAASDIKEYGWANIREFVAEAFSNPKFKGLLKEINKADGTNAYAEFRRLVAPYLGAAGMAMTPEVQEALDTIIDAKDEASKDGA